MPARPSSGHSRPSFSRISLTNAARLQKSRPLPDAATKAERRPLTAETKRAKAYRIPKEPELPAPRVKPFRKSKGRGEDVKPSAFMEESRSEVELPPRCPPPIKKESGVLSRAKARIKRVPVPVDPLTAAVYDDMQDLRDGDVPRPKISAQRQRALFLATAGVINPSRPEKQPGVPRRFQKRPVFKEPLATTSETESEDVIVSIAPVGSSESLDPIINMGTDSSKDDTDGGDEWRDEANQKSVASRFVAELQDELEAIERKSSIDTESDGDNDTHYSTIDPKPVPSWSKYLGKPPPKSLAEKATPLTRTESEVQRLQFDVVALVRDNLSWLSMGTSATPEPLENSSSPATE